MYCSNKHTRLPADKAATLRIILSFHGCVIVAAPVHAPSRELPFFSPSFLHTISLSPVFTSA